MKRITHDEFEMLMERGCGYTNIMSGYESENGYEIIETTEHGFMIFSPDELESEEYNEVVSKLEEERKSYLEEYQAWREGVSFGGFF